MCRATKSIFDRLQEMALSSAESAEFIATMAKEPQ